MRRTYPCSCNSLIASDACMVHLGRNCASFLCACLLISSTRAASDWEKTVSPLVRGSFPNPRPLQATYNFGWNDVIAATAEVDFAKDGNHLQLQGTGQTFG